MSFISRYAHRGLYEHIIKRVGGGGVDPPNSIAVFKSLESLFSIFDFFQIYKKLNCKGELISPTFIMFLGDVAVPATGRNTVDVFLSRLFVWM